MTVVGRATGVAYLAMLRLPLGVVNGLAVVIGFVLLRRLLRPQTALLAALLWALSPFLIAHSRLLHLDGLLTSFMTLNVLVLLQAGMRIEPRTDPSTSSGCNREPLTEAAPLWPIILAGVFGGLALLTKAPSLLLLPVSGLLLLLVSPSASWGKRVIWAVGRYLVWLVVALLVLVAGWPAMWVGPREAVMTVVNEVIVNGGQPHHSGNFFLGREVGDPGWLFYPAVILWRTSPITLLGLFCLPFVVRRGDTPEHHRERRAFIGLLIFALLFTVALSIEPKKFDRYLLPIWPALEIMAAAGLVGFVRQGDRETGRQGDREIAGIRHQASGIRYQILALVTLVFILVGQLAWYQPYYLAYFDPLLGGGAVAQRVMLVGWGEGMEDVGAWLSKRPDLNSGPVLSVIGPTLSPFVPDLVLDLQEKFLSTHPSYAVLYARSQQRDESATAQDDVRKLPPLWTLRKYGIEYAQVYQLPRPFDTPLDAVFGEGLHLRGFSQAMVANTLVITPSWDVQRDQPGGRFAFLHVIGPDGKRVAQADVPIDGGMFPTWQAGQQFGGAVPLGLPADLPPGAYRVVLGVYDPASGARLPLTLGSPLPADVAGPDAILLHILQR